MQTVSIEYLSSIIAVPESQISYPTKAALTQATTATKSAPACTGIACRISFSTPDGDVNGVDPVKFIARYELIAMVMNIRAAVSNQKRLFLKNNTTIRPMIPPVSAPFSAKARPGIQGSKMGAATAPARIPPA